MVRLVKRMVPGCVSLRRQTKLIGAKWLRDGNNDGRNSSTEKAWNGNRNIDFTPTKIKNQDCDINGENQGGVTTESKELGVKGAYSKDKEVMKENNQSIFIKLGVTITENKKRRTDDGMGLVDDVKKNTELDKGLDGDDIVNIEQETQYSSKII